MIDKYCDALKSAVKGICEVQILDSCVSGMFKTSLYLFGDAVCCLVCFVFFFKIHIHLSDTVGYGRT